MLNVGSMSVEEDVELRDMITQTLDLNGCLSKIRAQLRANLFLALDEDEQFSQQKPLLNERIETCLKSPEGKLMFYMVHDFLEFFNLDFTISVFEAESSTDAHTYEGAESLAGEMGLKGEEAGPVLLQLLKIAQSKNRTTLEINLPTINGDSNKGAMDSISESYSNGSGVVKATLEDGVAGSTKKPLDSTYILKETESDTINGTSSIEEESKPSEPKSTSGKSDKSPSCLSNKKLNDILPSMYNKDFKCNKDFDFHIRDDYDEDFMSGTEMEFSLSKRDAKPLMEELQQCNSFNSSNGSNKVSSMSGLDKINDSSGDCAANNSDFSNIFTNDI